MNKVCLVLSIGLLTMSTQQFCNRSSNQSLAERTQDAKRAHEAADRRYQKARANYDTALASGASTRRLDELERQTNTAREEYNQTKRAYEQAQKSEQQQSKDFALAQALQKQEDEKLAQHLQSQEYAKANQAPVYDAPPSYAQATGSDLAYKVAAAHTLLDDIERTNSSIAEQFIKSRYKKYNNCWWCK